MTCLLGGWWLEKLNTARLWEFLMTCLLGGWWLEKLNTARLLSLCKRVRPTVSGL